MWHLDPKARFFWVVVVVMFLGYHQVEVDPLRQAFVDCH